MEGYEIAWEGLKNLEEDGEEQTGDDQRGDHEEDATLHKPGFGFRLGVPAQAPLGEVMVGVTLVRKIVVRFELVFVLLFAHYRAESTITREHGQTMLPDFARCKSLRPSPNLERDARMNT